LYKNLLPEIITREQLFGIKKKRIYLCGIEQAPVSGIEQIIL
jgi:hypothetical protein